MGTSIQDQKRQRAAAFPPATGAAPSSGLLDVGWDSPFDRLCFMVSSPDLATKNKLRYGKLLAELTTGSACTEDEVLAHGNKVRAVLYFAQERIAREGHLDQLTGREKYAFRLAPVIPAF